MTRTLLAGVHDREGAHIVPAGGWCVDTVALAESPRGTDYTAIKADIHWIARLNWGYGSTGTIPQVAQHGEMAQAAGLYVAESRGCHRWIVGNEPNHSQERPGGRMISPAEYARCFVLVRQAIQRAQPDAIVIPAPVAPWNVESGDWLEYQYAMLHAIGPENFDGVAVHAYIRACEPDRVQSQATMDPPFGDRASEWGAYRQTLAAMPSWAQRLPAYVTEANPLDGWQARGVMGVMLGDVAHWNRVDANRTASPPHWIECVCFYRYPAYDRWSFGDKPGVVQEFRRVAPEYAGPGRDGRPATGDGEAEETQELPAVVSLPVVSGGGSGPAGEDVWRRCLAFVLRWEGGWADHPADPGGATMRGITLATYTRWRQERGQPAPSKADLRAITLHEVGEIYRAWYWLDSGANRLAWPLCLIHFDTAVNAGPARAQALLAQSGGNFLRYMGLVIDWYTRINNFETFGRAWIRRRAEVLLEAAGDGTATAQRVADELEDGAGDGGGVGAGGWRVVDV